MIMMYKIKNLKYTSSKTIYMIQSEEKKKKKMEKDISINDIDNIFLVTRNQETIVYNSSPLKVTIYHNTKITFPKCRITITSMMLILRPFERALIEIPLQSIRALFIKTIEKGIIRRKKIAYLDIKYYPDPTRLGHSTIRIEGSVNEIERLYDLLTQIQL